MIEGIDLRLVLLRSLSPFSPSIASFSRIADLSLVYTPNEMEGRGKAKEKGLKIDEKVFLFLLLLLLHSKEKGGGGGGGEGDNVTIVRRRGGKNKG